MVPKVLVGCPTYEGKEYALKQYVEALKKLTYENFDILLVDNSKDDSYYKKIKNLGMPVVKGPYSDNAIQRISDSRNILRKKMLEEGYDYFLSLEQDVIPPVDVIQQLINDGTPIVSGVYFHYFTNNFGKLESKPIAYSSVSEKEFDLLKTDPKYKGTQIREKIEKGIINSPEDIHAQLSLKDVQGNKLLSVLFTGVGCMLISRKVLEKIEFRIPEDSFDDYSFCKDARELGYQIWLDTKIKCGHVIQVPRGPDAS